MADADDAWLTGDLTHLALLWRIVRRDGVALGFTTHDRPLWRAGLRHDSAPGMAPSAVVTTAGLDADSMDIAGALSADAITAVDLAAGRYSGAAVQLTLVDWRDADGPAAVLARGTLGAVTVGGGGDPRFEATLRSHLAALDVQATDICSPECRADFGDRRCRVPLRAYRRRVRVIGAGVRLVVADLPMPDAYAEGAVRLLDGRGAGLERRIVAIETAGDRTSLLLDAPLAAATGDYVELTQGCDRRFATCRDRFGNAANFRGEPHVPGGDLLARFGGF